MHRQNIPTVFIRYSDVWRKASPVHTWPFVWVIPPENLINNILLDKGELSVLTYHPHTVLLGIALILLYNVRKMEKWRCINRFRTYIANVMKKKLSFITDYRFLGDVIDKLIIIRSGSFEVIDEINQILEPYMVSRRSYQRFIASQILQNILNCYYKHSNFQMTKVKMTVCYLGKIWMFKIFFRKFNIFH